MPKRPLELEIRKGSRPADVIEVNADPDDPAAIGAELARWLKDHKWAPGTWGQFEAHVRYPGEYKVRKKVRAPR